MLLLTAPCGPTGIFRADKNSLQSGSASLVLFLLIAIFGCASAATFTIKNYCPYTVWPAATPVGGGTQLNPGQTWTINVPSGTKSGRVWGHTGCSFNSGGHGHCQTGDCGGALCCTLSRQPPLTLAEFTIGYTRGANDYYNISVIDGYNLPKNFSCSTGMNLHCCGPHCPDAYLYPTDDKKTHGCRGNSNYR